MPQGIRRYGPGKFNTILDSYVYELSLDGGSDDCGDVGEIGIIYSRLELGSEALDAIKAEAVEDGDTLTSEEETLIKDSFGAILTENDQGFVSVDYIKTKKEYDKDWKEIEEEVEDMYEGDDGEDEEEEDEEEEKSSLENAEEEGE